MAQETSKTAGASPPRRPRPGAAAAATAVLTIGLILALAAWLSPPRSAASDRTPAAPGKAAAQPLLRAAAPRSVLFPSPDRPAPATAPAAAEAAAAHVEPEAARIRPFGPPAQADPLILTSPAGVYGFETASDPLIWPGIEDNFAAWPLARQDCLYRPAIGPGGARAKVTDYRATLEMCARDDRRRVAIRDFAVGGGRSRLLVDPERLTTSIESDACWRCRPSDETELGATRYLRAVVSAAEAPGLTHRTFLQNAGLRHGAAAGQFITGDLCPCSRPLDRRFFETLLARPGATPVALSISGLWLLSHSEDFGWLMRLKAERRLDILWINHSYHHPFYPRRPLDANFLLAKGVDPAFEILGNEKLLIENGGTPSVFFRFPGLISSAPLMKEVRRLHIVSLGADAWLAKGEAPRSGAIILVHPNGNEEAGINDFSRLYANGEIAPPFMPLTLAPQ